MGLTGLLMARGPLAVAQDRTAAQAQDSAPMTLIVAVFPEPTGAGQAMSQMPSAQKAQVQSYAVVSKDANGKVKVQDKKSKKGAQGARANQSVDGAVALLGQRPNQGGNANAARQNPSDRQNAPNQQNPSQQTASAQQAGVSQADADKISAMLPPDNSAIILVVPATDVAPMDAALQQASPNQVVGAELVPVP
jgi:hypothetical protein